MRDEPHFQMGTRSEDPVNHGSMMSGKLPLPARAPASVATTKQKKENKIERFESLKNLVMASSVTQKDINCLVELGLLE